MQELQAVSLKNSVRILISVGLLLLIPLAFTLLNSHASLYGGTGGGWDWTTGDFAVMGALLFCAGYAIAFAIQNLKKSASRVTAVALILAALFLVWIELAVDGVSQLVRFLTA